MRRNPRCPHRRRATGSPGTLLLAFLLAAAFARSPRADAVVAYDFRGRNDPSTFGFLIIDVDLGESWSIQDRVEFELHLNGQFVFVGPSVNTFVLAGGSQAASETTPFSPGGALTVVLVGLREGALYMNISGSGIGPVAHVPGEEILWARREGLERVDADGDSWADLLDNCPGSPNFDQRDRDGDSLGDPCDPFPGETDHEKAQYRVDLEVLGHDLEGLRVELEGTAAQLDACLARPVVVDQDLDGEADRTDACADTPPGAEVDQAGCSIAQFCAAAGGGTASCLWADWRNDEPLGDPRDCQPSGSRGLGSCRPSPGSFGFPSPSRGTRLAPGP